MADTGQNLIYTPLAHKKQAHILKDLALEFGFSGGL